MSKLRTLVNECVKELNEEIIACNLLDKDIYANWLAQTYFYTCKSEEILRLSAEKSVDQSLAARWLDHADEEKGHENLAMSDLKKLGFRIEEFQEYEETRLFYQTQIFNAHCNSAESVFGWVLALEAFAAKFSPDYLESIIKVHGKNACRFLIVHTNEDIEHIEKAFKSVEKLENRDDIIENMHLTTRRYINMLRRCAAEVKEKQAA